MDGRASTTGPRPAAQRCTATATPAWSGWLRLLWRAPYRGVAASLLLALLVPALVRGAVAAESAAGLRLYASERQQVGLAPLLETDVHVRVSGMLARVRVVQRFRNMADAWVEGVYVFPLPPDAAVDRLRMRYAGRLIEGEIQERGRARETYERARAAGRGAGLIDQQRANVFTTAVANIPPGEGVEVAIEYQQTLQWRDGGYALRFPMVVAPRYIPGSPRGGGASAHSGLGWARDTDQVPDASRISPPVVEGAGPGLNPLSLAVDLEPGLELADIASPYHAIEVAALAPRRYRVRLADAPVPAERDFVLRWRPVAGQQPTAALFTETWRGRQYGLLMLMPPQDEARPAAVARELILVVDTSGSMHGDSIEQARRALLVALAQLGPGDRFNIIQFNNATAALFDEPVPADAAHLAQARRYVQGLDAGGGTEMLPAMRRALHAAPAPGLLRQVVFLTDGAVGNERALFAAVAQHIGQSRLFTVGIGAAPNALFMTQAARVGRGTFTYIGSTAEVAAEMVGLFRRISAPLLTDLHLSWEFDGAVTPVVQAPAALPDLYAGEPLSVALAADALPRRVHIEGRYAGRPWRRTLELQDGAPGQGVHALWARRTIEDALGRGLDGVPIEEVRAAVVGLALEHHLVSRYTSLVAVDKTPRRPQSAGLAATALPVRLPAGWSGAAVFGRLPGTATPAALAALIGLSLLLLALLLTRRPR